MLLGPCDFKVALNGAHAYLHLDHLHLSGKFHDLEVILLLNMHTPLADGFEFLNLYKENSSLPKKQIRILVKNEKRQKRLSNCRASTLNFLL